MQSLEEIILKREKELNDISFSNHLIINDYTVSNIDPTFYLELDKCKIEIHATFRYDTSPPKYILELTNSEKILKFNKEFDSELDYSVDFGHELILNAVYNEKIYRYSYGRHLTMSIEKSKYDERFENMGIKTKSKKNILSFHNNNDYMSFEYDEDSKEIKFYKGSFSMIRDELYNECFGK